MDAPAPEFGASATAVDDRGFLRARTTPPGREWRAQVADRGMRRAIGAPQTE
jgi:hypothetical protein